MCLQVDISSDLELSRLDLLAVVMKYFSQRQRLQRCDLGVYGSARFRIFHVILWGIPFSLSCQIYLLNSVEFLSLLFLKDWVWFPYRVLKVVSVRPIYVSLDSIVAPWFIGWLVVTVA